MSSRMELLRQVEQLCEQSGLPAVSVSAGYSDTEVVSGTWRNGQRQASDCPYLVASITKPVVAMAAIHLVTSGKLLLNDRVAEWLPQFSRPGLRSITIRHLLTHTCGLPDMLPENQELRASRAGLQAFVDGVAECTPEFAAGTDCRYSSMGFAVLGRIVETITRASLQTFLAASFFEPLQMRSTWLGVPDALTESMLPEIALCELPVWQEDSAQWNWNSRYWRTLGAPWGGLISTAGDLGRYAQMILRQGRSSDGTQVLPPLAVSAATRCQTADMFSLSDTTRRMQQWGFGWRMNWPGHAASLSELLPPEAFGHWGATGTLMWICPTTDAWAVMLSTVPYERSQPALQRLSNVLATGLSGSPLRGELPG